MEIIDYKNIRDPLFVSEYADPIYQDMVEMETVFCAKAGYMKQ